MRKIFLTMVAILILFLSGCHSNNEADIPAYSDEIAKAQEITVVSADTSEVIETMTAKDDIEDFILALDMDKWKLKSLPDTATEIGTFNLSQEETIQFEQTDTDGTLYDVAAIILYDNSYVGFEICDINMFFEVSKTTADYLNGYFE